MPAATPAPTVMAITGRLGAKVRDAGCSDRAAGAATAVASASSPASRVMGWGGAAPG
jgi:hypothetical protein